MKTFLAIAIAAMMAAFAPNADARDRHHSHHRGHHHSSHYYSGHRHHHSGWNFSIGPAWGGSYYRPYYYSGPRYYPRYYSYAEPYYYSQPTVRYYYRGW